MNMRVRARSAGGAAVSATLEPLADVVTLILSWVSVRKYGSTQLQVVKRSLVLFNYSSQTSAGHPSNRGHSSRGLPAAIVGISDAAGTARKR